MVLCIGTDRTPPGCTRWAARGCTDFGERRCRCQLQEHACECFLGVLVLMVLSAGDRTYCGCTQWAARGCPDLAERRCACRSLLADATRDAVGVGSHFPVKKQVVPVDIGLGCGACLCHPKHAYATTYLKCDPRAHVELST